MGSFFSPQQLETKQTASTTALKPYANNYKQLLNRGLDVSNTPYNPATNAGVAGFAAPQTQAFQATQNMQGAYQPYLQAAGLSALTGTTPTYQTVGNYMNPYNQEVVNSLIGDYDTMINRNRQMQMSDAAKAGALTGDRRYVAQTIAQESLDAELARNLANTRQRGYETGLQAAQYDSGQGLRAAQTLADLGRQAQTLGYQDVDALLGIGGMQQGLQQKELDTATQNAIRQSAYPFETTQWATNLATQLGGAAGSQSKGSTMQPGPTPFQQVAGAGLAGLGMYFGAKDGGAIHGYAQGGSPFFGGLSYVPQTKNQSRGLAPAQFAPAPKIESTGMDKLLSNFTNAYGSVKKNRKPTSTWTNPDTGEISKYYEPTNLSKFGSWLGDQANTAWGGLSNLASNTYGGISSGLGGLFGYNDSGVVRHGYQVGGGIASNPFDYYTSYVPDNSDFVTRTQSLLPETTISSPEASPQAWETITTEEKPQGLMNLGGPKEEPEGKSLFGFRVSPEAANALTAAGFAMMASPSPFIGQAIGQGGLAGLGYYTRTMQDKQEQENELKKALIQHAAGGNKPSAIQVYEYIKNLPEKEKSEFYKAQRGEKWIDGGTYWKNTETGEEIPKNLFGAEESKVLGQKSGEKKADLGTVNSSYASSILTDKYLKNSINHAKSLANSFTTGFLGSVGATITGSPSSDLAVAMRNIEANLAFDALKDLKAAGGTLGAVSKDEMDLLKTSLIALNQAQSYDEFVRALDELIQMKAERAALRKAAYEDYIKEFGEGNVPDYVKKAMEGTLVPRNNSSVRTYNPKTGTAD